MTSKTKTVLACVECGTAHAKWSGQCSACEAWNSIVEETVDVGAAAVRQQPQFAPLSRLDIRG